MNRYVKDILTNTSSSIEQVTIEPDGSWHVPTPKTEERRSSASAPRDTSFIGDDDLMIAQPNAPSSSRATATPNRFYGASLGGSSIADSRETSLMPGSATSRSGTSNKRAAPETIDLTLSDDDEPPPAHRPAKRQNVGSENPAPYSAGEYSY
jgi:E3 SUMO-protein ligase PIAS1